MPLEKAAPGTPGFKRNIEREVAAGKPQKQAVAIAYSKARGDGGPEELLQMDDEPDISTITHAVRKTLADDCGPNTELGHTQTTPDSTKQDGPLKIELEHLCDADKERLMTACDRADSMSTRLAQLEKKDAARRIPR